MIPMSARPLSPWSVTDVRGMRAPSLRCSPFLAAAVLACSGDPAQPSGTGSLVLEIVSTQSLSAVAAPGPVSSTDPSRPASIGRTSRFAELGFVTRLTGPRAPEPVVSRRSVAAPPLDRVEVRLAGPTNRTVTLNNDGTAFEGTIDDLNPGLYQVTVVGFGVGEVTFFGRTNDVRVNANETTTAGVTFNEFVTTLDPFVTPTLSFVSPINFPLVANANVYRIEVDSDPSFPDPAVDSIPDSDGWAWFVLDVGTYYMRLRAGNASIPAANAAPSNVESFEVVADTVGDDWPMAYEIGTSTGASGRYAGNITPGDRDWYQVNLNLGDQIGLRVRSTTLTPTSNLDPEVLIQNSLQVVVASNDDADQNTVESVIDPFSVGLLGTYYIRVTAHQDASVGQYELVVSINGVMPRRTETPAHGTFDVGFAELNTSVVRTGEASIVPASIIDTTR